MKSLETDYLVIGSGAVSMTFVDTMLQENADASFIIVDRHHMPGGHWNDAYSFVRLHQPSAFYGVVSTKLGSDRVDTTGPNKGFFELASGAEVLSYFDRVMRDQLLASGRVQYFPLHEYQGEGRFISLLGDEAYSVNVRKSVVDGTFFNTNVPSVHERKFPVAEETTCVPPNDLPRIATEFENFAVLGGGKTAMDVAVWLLDHGVKPEAITWVCPRASWLINRTMTQPGIDFFEGTAAGTANQFEAMAAASSVSDLFERFEAAGVMLRVNKDVAPSMFHYATISEGEVAQLARIKNTIHGARVERVDSDGMVLSNGQIVPANNKTLCIDCTASAVIFNEGQETIPVFEEGQITLQAVYAPLVTYSAAIIARIEAKFDDIDKKNSLSQPIRFCDTPEEWMGAAVQNLMNQNIWNQTPELKEWITTCRLNPTAQAIAEGAGRAPEQAELLKRIRTAVIPAVMNTQKLIAGLEQAD